MVVKCRSRMAHDAKDGTHGFTARDGTWLQRENLCLQEFSAYSFHGSPSLRVLPPFEALWSTRTLLDATVRFAVLLPLRHYEAFCI